MNRINNLTISLLILALSGAVSALFLPYFVIDETRYLTVAWEMKSAHSIVPLLNGLPYSHKPPLLFFLINLDWLLFGVNEQTLRLIPLFFSFLNILMTYKIALALWGDRKIARYATAILTSTLIYLVWSTLIMFDIILTFWVLVGIYGLLSATEKNIKTSLILIGISIGGGLLTKGPVIFVHILPTSIFYSLWRTQDKPGTKKWFLMILSAIFTGLALALLWVVPAAINGGEEYRKAILWGQTAGRMTSSFDHQSPIWWYIPILPVMFMPWILIKPTWHGFSMIKRDTGYRFLAVWLVMTIAIFSLISCKRIHYLIPLLPAVSLITARNIVTYSTKVSEYSKLHYPLAIFYIISGVAAFGASFIKIDNIPAVIIFLPAFAFVLLGVIMFFIRPSSMDELIKIIALSSLVIFMSIVFIGSINFFSRYDVINIAQVLRKKQEEGYKIIHYGKYRGQYQFLGRLTKPLVVLSNKKIIDEYVATHKKVLLVSYEEPEKIIDKAMVLYQQPYRGKKVILWKEKGINFFLNSH